MVRDGKGFAPLALDQFRLLPGTAASISRLREAGFVVIVVTNQPDVGHRLVSIDVVEAMHRRLRAGTEVDDIEMCTHKQRDGCDCRKPEPGMLLAAARKHDLDLSRSYMVGDRASDVEAGMRAGCTAVFIDRGYAEPAPTVQAATVKTFPAAVDFILSHSSIR